jgi:hypothetical protein
MNRNLVFLLAIWALLASCNDNTGEAVAGDWEHIPDTSIHISELTDAVLPQAGNVALIEANCTPCHSLRYIEMQPALSYHTWEKIVDKMIITYGAPVRDSVTRQNIIDYLHAIRGSKDQ